MLCRYRAFALSAILLACSAASFAGSYGETAFARLDKDGDGYIDAHDLAPMRERMFKRLDRDGDGYLSRAETTPPNSTQPAPSALPWRDTDGDGRISRAEFDATQPALIARADKDGDQRLSHDEFAQLIAQRPARS
ncbi:EF-hand domain-containing protein [Pseudomonas citronellolis]|uniref:EF-hand domain-containing protein n=1 Tax=Pseudomonas citronellolis TaxID=53408 RepID=UPI0023E457CC|nr:EF-hand domain-containing protein [Pseudomonas citronellolis]MDF3933366.1 EF-hand domain-containing protein [Pseudomonas citronellolis]